MPLFRERQVDLQSPLAPTGERQAAYVREEDPLPLLGGQALIVRVDPQGVRTRRRLRLWALEEPAQGRSLVPQDRVRERQARSRTEDLDALLDLDQHTGDRFAPRLLERHLGSEALNSPSGESEQVSRHPEEKTENGQSDDRLDNRKGDSGLVC